MSSGVYVPRRYDGHSAKLPGTSHSTPFGWAALDVLMATLMMARGQGPRSALLVGYPLLIVGTALRFLDFPALVRYCSLHRRLPQHGGRGSMAQAGVGGWDKGLADFHPWPADPGLPSAPVLATVACGTGFRTVRLLASNDA